MKLKAFRLISFLLCIPLVLWARKAKYKDQKTYKERYTVSSDARVSLANKYGNITIETWDQDEVEIEVIVSSSGRDEDDVQDRLDQADIKFSGNRTSISVMTSIEKNSGIFGWAKSNSASLQIDYLVKMPTSNALRVSNYYGDVYVEDFDGKTEFDINYGNLRAGKLNNESNYIELDYSSGGGTDIEYVKQANIDADYSNIDISNAEKLTLETDYSEVEVRKVDFLEANVDYGEIKVEEMKEFRGDLDYVVVKLGRISERLKIDSDYGSIRIAEIASEAKLCEINGDYTGIDIGLASDINCRIQATLSYANFEVPRSANFAKKIVKNTSKYYEGVIGDAETELEIRLSSDYGNINLSLN